VLDRLLPFLNVDASPQRRRCWTAVSALALGCFLTFSTACGRQQLGAVPGYMRSWNEPSEPFRVVGNVYSVGTSGMGVYLITTSAGHILLDSAFEASVPMIADNVRRLGFRFEDIKILLASHGHIDHVGGHARVRELTGARVLASTADARLFREGGRGDFAYGDTLAFRPCPPDGLIGDGDKVELGGTTLVAHATPGHTEGATTWTMEVDEQGRRLQVLFFPSGNVSPGAQLKDNPRYPGIVADFERSFARWKTMPCDVFLGAHTIFFDLDKKRARQKAGGPNPFIDPEGFRRTLEDQEQKFRARLAAE
jgi:metallo-beta-lactamase class B